MRPKSTGSGRRTYRRETPGSERKAMAPKKTCKVCNAAESKYKCPSCLIPYCSLTCFKTHKGTRCSMPESADVDISAPVPPTNIERTCYVGEPSEILQHFQLEAIASSSEIREAVKDEKLRKLIIDIDNSPAAENDLDKYMEVEVFRLFTDKVRKFFGFLGECTRAFPVGASSHSDLRCLDVSGPDFLSNESIRPFMLWVACARLLMFLRPITTHKPKASPAEYTHISGHQMALGSLKYLT